MVGPVQLTEKRLSDPALIEFTKKVTVNYDDDLNKLYPGKTASRVEITLKSGEKLTKQVDMPAGDPRDPMTSRRRGKKGAPVCREAGREKAQRPYRPEYSTLETVTDITQITKNI